MEPFFATVCVKLKKPVAAEGQAQVGYYIHVGLNAEDEKDAIQVIQRSLDDGDIDRGRVEWTDIKLVAPDVFAKFTNKPGIWYTSDRSFFPK